MSSIFVSFYFKEAFNRQSSESGKVTAQSMETWMERKGVSDYFSLSSMSNGIYRLYQLLRELRFKFLEHYKCSLFLTFLTMLFYLIVILLSLLKVGLYLNVLLNRIILRLWYVSFAHETLKCSLPQNFKVCNTKPYYSLGSCFICLVTMVISF